MITRNSFPILEYDEIRKAIIEPNEQFKSIDIPKHAILIFFHDLLLSSDKLWMIRR